MNVVGTASLGGQLQLALINGFAPAGGQTFSIVQAASLTGTFGNVANGQRVATIDDLGSFQVHYGTGSTFNPNQIVINNFIANPLPGDFNEMASSMRLISSCGASSISGQPLTKPGASTSGTRRPADRAVVRRFQFLNLERSCWSLWDCWACIRADPKGAVPISF